MTSRGSGGSIVPWSIRGSDDSRLPDQTPICGYEVGERGSRSRWKGPFERGSTWACTSPRRFRSTPLGNSFRGRTRFSTRPSPAADRIERPFRPRDEEDGPRLILVNIGPSGGQAPCRFLRVEQIDSEGVDLEGLFGKSQVGDNELPHVRFSRMKQHPELRVLMAAGFSSALATGDPRASRPAASQALDIKQLEQALRGLLLQSPSEAD